MQLASLVLLAALSAKEHMKHVPTFGMKQGQIASLQDASPVPMQSRPRYTYALCFSGLDDGPLGDLPFLLPAQMANIIPSQHFKSLHECILSGLIAFDIFVYVSISAAARPSQQERDAYDAVVSRVAKSAGVRAVTIVHGVDAYIQPHKLDSMGEKSIMGSSHGKLQNWLQQVCSYPIESIRAWCAPAYVTI
jgi:hypothetical protein